jgi:hypothetical protein
MKRLFLILTTSVLVFAASNFSARANEIKYLHFHRSGEAISSNEPTIAGRPGLGSMKAVQGHKLWGKERNCKIMNYVGIDTHKKYSVLAAVDEHGKELARGRVEGNTVEGFARFFGALPGENTVVLEACWNWGRDP